MHDEGQNQGGSRTGRTTNKNLDSSIRIYRIPKAILVIANLQNHIMCDIEQRGKRKGEDRELEKERKRGFSTGHRQSV